MTRDQGKATANSSIPQDWIRRYIDTMLEMAQKFEGVDSKMRDACALRADYAMDLVKAWREAPKK